MCTIVVQRKTNNYGNECMLLNKVYIIVSWTCTVSSHESMYLLHFDEFAVVKLSFGSYFHDRYCLLVIVH